MEEETKEEQLKEEETKEEQPQQPKKQEGVELPSLFLSKIMYTGDGEFIREKIELQSKGGDMGEAVAGFEYLLKKALKKLR